MGSSPRISEADVRKFVALVNNGMQRKAAAQEVGVDIKSIKYACKRLGIQWPGRTLLSEQLKQYEPQILAGTISQHQLAKELSCSQARLSVLFKELGYPAIPPGDPGPDAATKAERIRNCERVLEHLEIKGGYLKPTVLELGLPESFRHHVVEYAKTIDFNFEIYRFAHREYGHWLTLPGKAKPIYTCDYLLPAVCTKCGTTHEVSLVNMKSGATTQCMSCSCEERRGKALCRKCKCVETGEAIRSICQLSQKLGVPHSTVEYNFANFGKLKHDGLTYVLA